MIKIGKTFEQPRRGGAGNRCEQPVLEDMGCRQGSGGRQGADKLSPDGTGLHWLLNAGADSGFNGWIDGRRLIPPQPRDGALADEAWSAFWALVDRRWRGRVGEATRSG